MLLERLHVTDFRCHDTVQFVPGPRVNVLLGGNGAGKSSLLEAIGFLATLRSFRRAPDSAVIHAGSDTAVLRGQFTGEAGTLEVGVEIPAAGRQRVKVDGKRASGRAEVAHKVALVAFLPDDLDLVKRGPAYRREYVDDLAAQLWPAAAADQRDYDRALRQRNALLRREGRAAPVRTLAAWDERLCALGAAVIRRRLEALSAVAGSVSAFCREVSGGGERVDWQYVAVGVGPVGSEASPAEVAAALGGGLSEARAQDLDRRTTTVGPHRDEVEIFFQGRDLRTRASQGEQRTVALALRVAAFDLLADRRRAAPVLVLDDVFSELDGSRRARLVERLPHGQVFISSTHREDVPVAGMSWAVAPGSIRRVGE